MRGLVANDMAGLKEPFRDRGYHLFGAPDLIVQPCRRRHTVDPFAGPAKQGIARKLSYGLCDQCVRLPFPLASDLLDYSQEPKRRRRLT